jgi:dihydroneopterin aldolase
MSGTTFKDNNFQENKITRTFVMNTEMQIHLNNVKLFCYHGLDEGEEVLGGEFEVNLTATYIPNKIPVTDLSQTLDYTILLSMVQQRMSQPTSLLETLATEIASEIIAKFSTVTAVTISIFKLHPPITNFEGTVGVTFTIKRN